MGRKNVKFVTLRKHPHLPMRGKKIVLLIPRIQTESSTRSCPSLYPLLGPEHNQCGASGSAALNLCAFPAEIPPKNTLGALGGLKASSEFGVGFLNTTKTRIASDLQMKPEHFLVFWGLRRELAVLRILLRIKVHFKQPRNKVLPARHPADQSWSHCCQD